MPDAVLTFTWPARLWDADAAKRFNPYDEAIVQLGFDRPGIKVASLEGNRSTFHWTLAFHDRFWKRIDKAAS